MNSSLIDTAVIPAGGNGTRFFPLSSALPKEMLPLYNKPVILHVVEQVIASGIKNIIIVASEKKHVIEEFFTSNEKQREYCQELGLADQCDEIQKTLEGVTISFVNSTGELGNGTALKAAQPFLNGKPFVLTWADELIITKGDPCIKQCMDAYSKHLLPVISTVEIKDPNKRSHYGMAKLTDHADDSSVKEILEISEKPEKGTEPSVYASHGTYVLPNEIFTAYEKTAIGINNELWLVDIINTLSQDHKILGKLIEDGIYLDCGTPASYICSQVEFALNTPYAKEIKKDLQFLMDHN